MAGSYSRIDEESASSRIRQISQDEFTEKGVTNGEEFLESQEEDEEYPSIVDILSSKHHSNVIPRGNSTVLGALMNILNTTLGAGLLGFPLAFKKMGFIFGVIAVFVIGFLCWVSLAIVALTGRAIGQYNFEYLAKNRLGRAGFFVANFFVILATAGSMLSYFSKCFYSAFLKKFS